MYTIDMITQYIHDCFAVTIVYESVFPREHKI